MAETLEFWMALGRTVEAGGGPKFEPPQRGLIDALSQQYECPGWFTELIQVAYPIAQVRVGVLSFFPPLSDIIAFRNEDTDWPREWLPIEWSDGHRVFFLRSGKGAESAVWSCLREDGTSVPRGNSEWERFEELLDSLGALFAETREASFQVRAGERWLRPEAAARLEARFGRNRAQELFALFGVTTVDGVRAKWNGDRQFALGAMVLTGLLTALASAFVFLRGGGGWTVALALGALPAGLLAFCSFLWRRALARLRTL